VGARHGVRARLLPAEQGRQGRRPHQARRADRMGNPLRERAGPRARAAAAVVSERGCAGRLERVQREAEGAVLGEVALYSAELYRVPTTAQPRLRRFASDETIMRTAV